MANPSVYRVFVIGLFKTGTTSMCAALSRLGFGRYNVPGGSLAFYGDGRIDVQRGQYLSDLAARNYWYFRELYPDSKFVLTIRDEADWLASAREHLARKPAETEKARVRRVGATGLYEYNETYFRALYRRHNDAVMRDFAGTGDLLVHRLGRDGYAELCDFLDLPRLDEPWPWKNRRR